MICIHLTREQLVACWVNGTKACLGGESQLREGQERLEKLTEDQFVGQIGHAAGSIWWSGSMDAYLQAREIANAEPWKGDGGSDLQGVRIDFKTSMMRKSQDPSSYKLLVRPPERHKGCVYVLVLLPKFKVEELGQGLNVYIVGWAKEEDLPPHTETEGIFEGAYLLDSSRLRPVGAFYGKEIVESQCVAEDSSPVEHAF